jgi:hypothetical protein
MSNGKRSKFNDSQLEEQYTDCMIPKGSHIHKVQLFYSKDNSILAGLKFFGKNGELLLYCGDYEYIYVKG